MDKKYRAKGQTFTERRKTMWKKIEGWRIALGLLCACLLFSRSAVARVETNDDEKPPVTKIVLYKHGIGYFERIATVKDEQTITLDFKTNQMQDILTSLFAIDLDGGRITSIGYDSKDPIDKQLENILIRVPEGAALTQFIAQLKGAKVEVKIGVEVARGAILGIEPVTQKIDNMVLTAYKLILLRDDGALQPFNLFEVSSLKLLDDPIQKDLQRILDIYLKSKYTDRKTVRFTTSGKGKRNILIGYLVEMPIWKTSYRMILTDKKPFLQGWAILENPTDEDWNDVNISFVAGNPISFALDLYTSYYPQRPVLNLSNIIPLGATLFNTEELAKGDIGGEYEMDKVSDMKYEGRAVGGKMNAPMKKAKEMALSSGAPMESMVLNRLQEKSISELLSTSVNAIATGMKVGELFSYDAKSPVTIARHKAAMVPIVTEPVEGTKVLYYRASVSPRPMNAFYFTNSTKLTLETGPVTFFEGSTSVGEGLFRQVLQSGMKEIIPYAVETGCALEITGKNENKPIHKASFISGVMILKQYTLVETTYKGINKMDKNHTFYLDHQKNSDYALIETPKPDEEISGYYRFKMELPANKTVEFNVKEQKEIASQVYLQNTSLDQIRFYLSQPYMSKDMKTFMKEVSVLMQEIAARQETFDHANQEYQRLNDDHKRSRENLNVLRSDSPTERTAREKFVAKLQDVEDKISVVRKTMLDAQTRKQEMEKQLTLKIQGFSEK